MIENTVTSEINELKKNLNAVILAHSYQIPEVQEIADHVGDSLELSRLAATSEADVIVFAGVRFMAESAKLLSPDKTVLLPEKDAGCPMADMITVEQLKQMKAEHPGSPVVTYVNSNVEIKAMTDICCTSSNALKVVESLPDPEIIFIPDRNLGTWIQKFTKKKLHLNRGYCIVHDLLKPEDVLAMKSRYPGAVVIAHPECHIKVLEIADAVESTSGMTRYVKSSSAKEFIIATESGMNYRLQKNFPDRVFHSMQPEMVCRNMKKTTLTSIRDSMKKKQFEISVDPSLAKKAMIPLRRMLELK